MALPNLTQIFLPKRKTSPTGTAVTNTYQPTNNSAVLDLPTYRNHLTDIFTSRQQNDSRALLKDLFKYDTDISATVHAFMTMANTTPRFFVYDMEGNLDREGQKQFDMLLTAFTKRYDYSTGFAVTKSLREIAEDLRYMVLLRGGCAAELVFNKLLIPHELRQVDLATIEWFEKQPGQYKPQQTPEGSDQSINLDIPTFFVKAYRQNPTEIYTESMFVSSINTIAARQQVINDLYRIMQKIGYPRIEVSILEEVLRKNAPANAQADETVMVPWLRARMQEVANDLTNLRPEQAWVHTDAVNAKILGDGPGKTMDAKSIIEVLDAQNQAGLKTMASIIGKGKSGNNIATVEARVFSRSCDSLNGPVADLLSDIFTLAMRMSGYMGYVECWFDPVELRPELELEPQKVTRQARLQKDLSLGLITDDEYHLEMYGRFRPDSAPELSGTGFLGANDEVAVSTDEISPNSDPLGRSITPSNSEAPKSNSV